MALVERVAVGNMSKVTILVLVRSSQSVAKSRTPLRRLNSSILRSRPINRTAKPITTPHLLLLASCPPLRLLHYKPATSVASQDRPLNSGSGSGSGRWQSGNRWFIKKHLKEDGTGRISLSGHACCRFGVSPFWERVTLTHDAPARWPSRWTR